MYEQTPLQHNSPKMDESVAEFKSNLERLNTVKNEIKETVNCINSKVNEFRGIIEVKTPDLVKEGSIGGKGLLGEFESIIYEMKDLSGRLNRINLELIKIVG
jgi:hypothetical protein